MLDEMNTGETIYVYLEDDTMQNDKSHHCDFNSSIYISSKSLEIRKYMPQQSMMGVQVSKNDHALCVGEIVLLSRLCQSERH